MASKRKIKRVIINEIIIYKKEKELNEVFDRFFSAVSDAYHSIGDSFDKMFASVEKFICQNILRLFRLDPDDIKSKAICEFFSKVGIRGIISIYKQQQKNTRCTTLYSGIMREFENLWSSDPRSALGYEAINDQQENSALSQLLQNQIQIINQQLVIKPNDEQLRAALRQLNSFEQRPIQSNQQIQYQRQIFQIQKTISEQDPQMNRTIGGILNQFNQQLTQVNSQQGVHAARQQANTDISEEQGLTLPQEREALTGIIRSICETLSFEDFIRLGRATPQQAQVLRTVVSGQPAARNRNPSSNPAQRQSNQSNQTSVQQESKVLEEQKQIINELNKSIKFYSSFFN